MANKPKLDPKALIGRYKRCMSPPSLSEYDDDDDNCDVWYIDRLTGQEIFRYDGADPANRPPLGPSDAETMANMGHDIDAEITVSQSRVEVTEADIQSWAMKKAFKSEREEEFQRGEELLGELDLFTYLDLDGGAFDHRDYHQEEQTKIKPALERKGFTMISFSMGEQDSFGPLSRIVRGVLNGKGYLFIYG
jgi:hypothetical protein